MDTIFSHSLPNFELLQGPFNQSKLTLMVARIDLLPLFRPPGWRFSGSWSSGWQCCRWTIYQRYRWLVSDCAVRADVVVVFTPFLHFLTGAVKAHKPVSVQALLTELAVEVFDECIVGSVAGRPDMSKLLAFLRNQKNENCVVITDNINRFSSDIIVHWQLKALFSEAEGKR